MEAVLEILTTTSGKTDEVNQPPLGVLAPTVSIVRTQVVLAEGCIGIPALDSAQGCLGCKGGDRVALVVQARCPDATRACVAALEQPRAAGGSHALAQRQPKGWADCLRTKNEKKKPCSETGLASFHSRPQGRSLCSGASTCLRPSSDVHIVRRPCDGVPAHGAAGTHP